MTSCEEDVLRVKWSGRWWWGVQWWGIGWNGKAFLAYARGWSTRVVLGVVGRHEYEASVVEDEKEEEEGRWVKVEWGKSELATQIYSIFSSNKWNATLARFLQALVKNSPKLPFYIYCTFFSWASRLVTVWKRSKELQTGAPRNANWTAIGLRRDE